MKNTFHIDAGKACILAGLVDERGIVLDYADVTNDAVNAVADFLIQGIEYKRETTNPNAAGLEQLFVSQKTGKVYKLSMTEVEQNND